MPASRLLIFANPLSGRGRGTKILKQLIPALQKAGWAVEAMTTHPQTIENIDHPDSIDALIVIGGDGTLRAVIERLTQLIEPDRLPPVLFIGLGTANLMQQHLKLVYDQANLPADVIDLLRAKKIARVDTAIAGDHLFLLMASCGFDSLVVKRLAKARTGPITKLSYLSPIITSLTSYDFPPVTVEVDGKIVHANAPAQVYVGNVAEYGTGFPVLDRASSFDQRLDVCVMPCSSHAGLAQLLMLTLIGKHHDAPGVVYTTGQQIHIHSDQPIPLQIDGEDAGTTPVRIRLLDTPLGFIVR